MVENGQDLILKNKNRGQEQIYQYWKNLQPDKKKSKNQKEGKPGIKSTDSDRLSGE